MKQLLAIRGFVPFVIILFINAIVDIGHKITIQNVLLKSFEGDTLIILSALVNAMILLPFILLFSPSGYISDRFAKTVVIRYASIAAIVLTLLITFSYYQGWFYTAFALTFVLAIQSAIYSPSKYGLIKELSGVENLGAANGVVQAVTIVAILLSSILFSIVFENYYSGATTNEILQSIAPLGWVLVVLSAIECYNAYRLPVFEPRKKDSSFEMRKYLNLRYLKQNIGRIRSDQNIWLSILGLSIFWGVGQMVVAAFPAHYKAMTGDENVIIIQAILAVSAIGLIAGSILAGRLSKFHIELGIIPIGALGIFGSLLLFSVSTDLYIMGFASLLFGFFGGLVIVPLNASIQYFAKESELGTVLAGNNFIQNIVMVVFLLLTIVFVQLGLTSSMLFALSAIITLLAGLYSIKKLPHLFVRILLFPLLKTRYRLHVLGLQNLPQSGGVLLLGNHISWIDWIIIQSASPRAIKFVMAKSIYSKWYIKWFVEFFNVIPISGASSRASLEQIRERLDNGEVVALFPEGRISYNAQLGEFKKGFEIAIKDTNHPIVPFYIHGLWGSTFSRASQRFKKMSKGGSKREIRVIFGDILPSSTTAEVLKQKINALSNRTWEEQISASKPLQYSWLLNAKSQLFKRSIVDALGTDLSNGKVITAVLLFVKALKSIEGKNIGVLLPSSSVGSIVNMALIILGKRPVNLNYTLSNTIMRSAIDKADISTVISSEKFMKKLSAKGFDFSQTLSDELMLLENVGKTFSKTDKTIALLQAYLVPSWLLQKLYFADVSIDDTATILFSSGSEGVPKGIELTHKNLIANIKQISALLNFQDGDVVLNSLPIFHSFGLTVTTLLPLCEGVTMVSAPDPTDAPAIGKLAARYQATIMFGTSTFFRLYTRNRKLNPLMFDSIRMVVAGAEKLKPEIKDAFRQKFGLEIFEGYGTTETSPVISVNMPNALDMDSMRTVVANKSGSVGQALPGTIIKIVDPSTLEELDIDEDGLILVGGPQVMKGYLSDAKKSSEVLVEIEGVRFYKSGDKGHVDGDGFITIVDRYSRFAKIAGEMISLGSVEEQLERVLGEDVELIAVNLSDEKKGEKVILLYKSEHSPKEIQTIIKQSDIIALMQPSEYFYVETLPKLASGKSDFKGAKNLALQLCS